MSQNDIHDIQPVPDIVQVLSSKGSKYNDDESIEVVKIYEDLGIFRNQSVPLP